ncbi:hypothetical protein B5C34_01050 [Pacificimonas flava]|uniref:LPS export ABC transporter periplasmic protein LptC n=2 Tax=Pacificimonas TaxID=1960290 RepID=A0A219B1U4_9SPHN|nr:MULTISPECIES: LPS export ABC transporter periplasmic protein LptC [Pacificimonas]MBZ6378198.1 LPS export ABC transporter periplasmic protein LptC [Pacificimonas aurantium]OWV32174.1 hypothetical protein B5C34_01050 [Pacificimonas flava]
MSRAADELRASRARWALPGSAWDRFTKIMAAVLPVLAALLLAAGLIWPLTQDREFSFILSKDEVEMAGDRMRLGEAVYRGEDDLGRPFLIRASRGVQETSADPRVYLVDLSARLQMDEGLATVTAERGVYDLADETLFIDGPVLVSRDDGYGLATSDVLVSIPGRTVVGEGRIDGSLPLGTFSGDRLRADLETRRVLLEGDVRMRINP